jgi:hypothetical protein
MDLRPSERPASPFPAAGPLLFFLFWALLALNRRLYLSLLTEDSAVEWATFGNLVAASTLPRGLACFGLAVALATASTADAGIDDGLIAEYRFEGNTADSSGNGNDGTPHGEPAYVAGHAGQAVALDGINDYVSLPGDLWTTDFTTAFWVRATAVAPTGTYWYQGLGMVECEVCGSPAGGDFGVALIDGGHVISWGTMSTTEINEGLFHPVIVTRSTVDDTVKTYINGQFDVAYQLAPTGLTGMPWIDVGNNPCDVSYNRRWFPSDVDELRFYNRVLADDEIAELSGGGLVGVPPVSANQPLLASFFPNPARGRATLMLALSEAADAHLEIFDVRGARARTLASGRWPAGSHFVQWPCDDSRGRLVRPGLYLVVLRAGTLVEHHKLVLIR